MPILTFPAPLLSFAAEIALAKCEARKRFKKEKRLLTWHCPENTTARYIRVQLEGMDYLHMAQVEVIGMFGDEKTKGRVASVSCGHHVTSAVIRPLADPRDVEECYRRAVIADPENLLYLRQYETFIREFENFGDFDDPEVSPWARFDDEIPKKCSLCRGAVLCEPCYLLHTWQETLTDVERGPGGRLRRLKSVSEILIEAPKPPLQWDPPPLKDRSLAAKLKRNIKVGKKKKKKEDYDGSDEGSDDD